MSAELLTTIPGDIPGLLRHGSPVLWEDEPCLVQCSRDGTYQRVDGDVSGNPDASALLLDLTDPTGRAHAAWWLMDRWRSGPRLPVEDRGLVLEACRFAEQGADMTSEQIDTFARLVLRLAGRAA